VTTAKGRERLSAVLRGAGDFITVTDAVAALHIDPIGAAKLLARWHEQGWLQRVRRGLYAPVPLTSSPDDQIIENPWTLVPALFHPGYVGGASAAHHWDLTEQLFRTTFVYTTRPVRRARQTIRGLPFVVRHIPPAALFGTRALWLGRAKVQISDLHRTIVDMLDDPAFGGGIRHVEDCLRAYFARSDADPELLLSYAERLGNGAILKRLGFLAERSGGPATLLAACGQRLTSGNAKLDPAMQCPRLVRRWRLWIPTRWKAEAQGD